MFAPVNDAFSEPLLAVSPPFSTAAAPSMSALGLLLMPGFLIPYDVADACCLLKIGCALTHHNDHCTFLLCFVAACQLIQHSTAQHSTAQHSTAQHSTAQHSTAQHSTAQHSTAQHSTAQHSTAQHSTAQHSTSHALLKAACAALSSLMSLLAYA